MKRMLAVLMSVVLFSGSVPLAAAGPEDETQGAADWSRVAALPTGQMVKVERHRGMGKAVTGSLVSISETSLRVNGRSRWTGKYTKAAEIPREQVRRIYLLTPKTSSRAVPVVSTVVTYAMIGMLPVLALVSQNEEAVKTVAVVFVALLATAVTFGVVNMVQSASSKGTLVYEVPERG